jgi:hypothetical protein
MSQTSPNERVVTLLRGRSAWEMGILEQRIGLVALAVTICALVAALMPSPLPYSARYGFLALVAIGLGLVANAFWFGGYVSALREGAELKVGYTTSPLPHRPEVDLVLPRTGIVVRAAGEAAISEREYRDLIRSGGASQEE